MNINKNIEAFFNSEKFRSIYNRIKKDKKTLLIILMALLGIFFISLSEIKEYGINDNEYNEEIEEINFDDAEKRLKNIIKCIKGVGDVETYITYDCKYETVYAVNSDVKTDEKQVQSKSEYIITDEDTGLILKMIYPKIRGVAIVCQGGDDPVIKEKIYSVVSALFDISTNKISVADME